MAESIGATRLLEIPMTHRDTSFLIRALEPGAAEDRKLRRWLEEGRTLGMSAIAGAEFLCGPLARDDVAPAAEIIGRRRDFTKEQATVAAPLLHESGRRRGSWVDCTIAGAALADGAAIATANPADFSQFEDCGLKTV